MISVDKAVKLKTDFKLVLKLLERNIWGSCGRSTNQEALRNKYGWEFKFNFAMAKLRTFVFVFALLLLIYTSKTSRPT